jgi:hypothetical protein
MLRAPADPLALPGFSSALAHSINGLSGFRIEFKKDPTGKVTEAVFYQPDTVTVLKEEALGTQKHPPHIAFISLC